MQRMHGKYRSHKPRARHDQPPQDAPQQQRIDQVQQHVDNMIARRRESPQLVLQPKTRVHHRPVMRLAFNLAGRKPDLRQTGHSLNRFGVCNDHVIPYKAGIDRGKIADRHQQHQRENRQDGLPRQSALRGRALRLLALYIATRPRWSSAPRPSRFLSFCHGQLSVISKTNS